MAKKAVVRYRSLRSNLVHLPLSIYAGLVQQQVRPQGLVVHLKILHSRSPQHARQCHLGWSGMASASSLETYTSSGGSLGNNAPTETIEIDPEVAAGLFWMEGDVVEVGLIHAASKAVSVSVTPHSADDWEVLERHTDYLENNLLSQLRAASKGQLVNVWVMGKTKIKLRIDETNPPTTDQTAVLIANTTEIFVAPKPRQQARAAPSSAGTVAAEHPTTHIESNRSSGPASTPISSIKQATDVAESALDSTTEPSRHAQLSKADTPTASLRVIPHRIALRWPDILDYIQSATPPLAPIAWVSQRTYTGLLSRFAGSKARKGVSDGQLWVEIEGKSEPTLSNAEAGPAAEGPSGKSEIDRHGKRVMLLVADELPDRHILVGVPGPVETNGSTEEFYITSVKPCKVPSGHKKIVGALQPTRTYDHGKSREKSSSTLAGVDKYLDECTDYFRRTKVLQTISKHGGFGKVKPLLLCGSSGCGKTSIAKEVAERLATDRTVLAQIHYVDCKATRASSGQSITTTREMIRGWVEDAVKHGPCILVLDGLDAVVRPDMENGDPVQTRAIAQSFLDTVGSAEGSEIMILATASSPAELHTSLRSKHLFGRVVSIPNASSEMRQAILTSLIRREYLEKSGFPPAGGFDFVSLAQHTEGYTPADLKDLVGIAIQQSLIRHFHTTDTTALGDKDFDTALIDFRPRSLRDVQLQKSDTVWADIGGLHETKRVLRETLEWPSKYGAIFASCPLRLRSGLLLYGYPGCGKTLLASAVAKECGLHFISVKGPELLNKYIGASEKSIRDIFARASAAKPCVLFFDEFDSIAPKRGHDSTGVTDRVVNQLLTEMDGAEGLEGVYVLAATSRPDLIDPALLRPGRLDKSLLCGMPSEHDRLEILKAASRKVDVADDTDMQSLAERTEGYTGADIQALIYNAQLEAIHSTIDASGNVDETANRSTNAKDLRVFQNGKMQNDMTTAEQSSMVQKLETILKIEDDQVEAATAKARVEHSLKPIITRQQLETSLAALRPSLPSSEGARLKRIYQSFISERSGSLPNGEAASGVGARASLM